MLTLFPLGVLLLHVHPKPTHMFDTCTQKDRQTGRQTDREGDGETERQADRQTIRGRRREGM